MNGINLNVYFALGALLLAIFSGNSTIAGAEPVSATFEGEKTSWHDGFDRYDYVMDEQTLAVTPFKAPDGEHFGVQAPPNGKRRCIVIVPKAAAPGNPWSWRGCYWDHEPQTEVELLHRGFHIAFITPDPGKEWDAWYAFLTERHGLSKKPAFIGMSKGGVNEYLWATAHPDKVGCIYADNPALTPESFQRLGDLAKNDVPLLHVCGSFDFLLEQHTVPVENIYHQLGGRISLVVKEGAAHHPHSLRDPKLIAGWIEQSVQPRDDKAPVFLREKFTKSYYYSFANAYNYLRPEDTYAACRGPLFTACYTRYDVSTNSQWGLTALSVIVPKTPAPGKPWVFRANRLGREPEAVDLALLDRGFHIVAAPITAQAGPLREEWDGVYKLLTDNGFATRAVMEGSGSGAGEAYAWAVMNPEKVSCIYAENPLLRSLMSKTPLLDSLTPLARAGVPILHICGSLDPLLKDNTRALEKRYRELGGQVTVLTIEGEDHFPLGPKDPKQVVDFIAAHTPSKSN